MRHSSRYLPLISDALPFGRLWYGESNAASNAVDYAKHRSRSHAGVIRVYEMQPVENIVESVYPLQCQMNLKHLKSMFLTPFT